MTCTAQVTWMKNPEVWTRVAREVVGFKLVEVYVESQSQAHSVVASSCSFKIALAHLKKRSLHTCRTLSWPKHLTILKYLYNFCQNRMCIFCNKTKKVTVCSKCPTTFPVRQRNIVGNDKRAPCEYSAAMYTLWWSNGSRKCRKHATQVDPETIAKISSFWLTSGD